MHLTKIEHQIMQEILGNIGDIFFGSYEKPELEGEIKYLHAGHFDELYLPSKFEGSYISPSSNTDKYLLQHNDVILAGKGHRLFAWAYNVDFGKAVPSSLFYIIRTNPHQVLGEYLAIVLNSERMQHKLKLIGAGATIPSVPKKELKQLRIPIPALNEQLRIMELVYLSNKDIELTQAVLVAKEKLRKGAINKMLNKMEYD